MKAREGLFSSPMPWCLRTDVYRLSARHATFITEARRPKAGDSRWARLVCRRIGNYCELFGGAALTRIWPRGAERCYSPPTSNPPSLLPHTPFTDKGSTYSSEFVTK